MTCCVYWGFLFIWSLVINFWLWRSWFAFFSFFLYLKVPKKKLLVLMTYLSLSITHTNWSLEFTNHRISLKTSEIWIAFYLCLSDFSQTPLLLALPPASKLEATVAHDPHHILFQMITSPLGISVNKCLKPWATPYNWQHTTVASWTSLKNLGTTLLSSSPFDRPIESLNPTVSSYH